jgi:hypothetical protein
MKKRVQVTIIKEIDVEIKDEQLTPEAIADFESYMFELEEDGPDGLLRFAAEHIARCGGDIFVEGIGQPAPFDRKGDHVLRYEEVSEAVESEIVITGNIGPDTRN